MNTEERIKQQLKDHPIILYMKGVPENPECGFSAKAVACLKATGIPYTYVNVLGAPFIREQLPKVSKWPTFPQLFVNGELVGGCDIIESLSQNGSLPKILEAAAPETAPADDSAVISKTEVRQRILEEYPGAELFIDGEGCDLSITIVSEKFAGQSMVKQQQGVMATLAEPLGSGRLHAVSIKAYTPEEWSKIAGTSQKDGLLQIQM